MKKLFTNVRKLSSSSTSTAFSLRRLSVNSSSSLNPPTIKVLRGGYNIDLEKMDSSFTKLHKAVYLNNEDRVKKYLASPKYSVNAVDSASRTALHLSAVNGNERVVKMLIMAGANANIQDNDGKTPMIKAVECSHPEVLHCLMEFGADLDLADKDKGNTALHHALITANLDCALYIIRNALIIDYNKRNHKQETFLHLAAKIVDLFPVIEELIANGIEIEAVDELGRTAAQIATLHANHEAHRTIAKYATASKNNNNTNQHSTSLDENLLPLSSNGASTNLGQDVDADQQQQHPVVSRATSLSSKLSSDSFGSNVYNYYRFSGLFEETIVEENKQNSSSGSSSSPSKQSDNQQKVKSTNLDDEENIYENYQPRQQQQQQHSSSASPVPKAPLSPGEEMSDDMSELDQMLQSGLNNSHLIELNVKPSSVVVNSSNSNGQYNQSVRNGNGDWLEMLEESTLTQMSPKPVAAQQKQQQQQNSFAKTPKTTSIPIASPTSAVQYRHQSNRQSNSRQQPTSPPRELSISPQSHSSPQQMLSPLSQSPPSVHSSNRMFEAIPVAAEAAAAQPSPIRPVLVNSSNLNYVKSQSTTEPINQVQSNTSNVSPSSTTSPLQRNDSTAAKSWAAVVASTTSPRKMSLESSHSSQISSPRSGRSSISSPPARPIQSKPNNNNHTQYYHQQLNQYGTPQARSSFNGGQQQQNGRGYNNNNKMNGIERGKPNSRNRARNGSGPVGGQVANHQDTTNGGGFYNSSYGSFKGPHSGRPQQAGSAQLSDLKSQTQTNSISSKQATNGSVPNQFSFFALPSKDGSSQTEEDLEYSNSNSIKHEQLLESIDRLLSSARSLSHHETNNNGNNNEGSDWNNEVRILKRLSSLVYDSNHNAIELDFKHKEVSLLKQTVDNLQAQIEHVQSHSKQLEKRMAKMSTGESNDRGKMANGYGPSELEEDRQKYEFKLQQYDSMLSRQLIENATLKQECQMLREQLKTKHSIVRQQQQSNGLDLTEVDNHPLQLATTELSSLIGEFDAKLNSLTELNQERVRFSQEESELRESFIEEFREEIFGLKRLMLLMADSDSVRSIPNGLPPEQVHIRRHSDFSTKMDRTNVGSKRNGLRKDSRANSKMSPRKSFSLHDLVNLDQAELEQQPGGGGGGPLNHKSFDDSHQLPTSNNSGQQKQSRSNLQSDYSHSFSYKSKYFQRKINELRKQLGINDAD